MTEEAANELRQRVEYRWQLLNHDLHFAERLGNVVEINRLSVQLRQLQELLRFGWYEMPDENAMELRKWLAAHSRRPQEASRLRRSA